MLPGRGGLARSWASNRAMSDSHWLQALTAKANSALFFPINPGKEEASWQRLHDEALDLFFAGEYAGAYEENLLKEFNACLPEKPSW